MLKIGEELKNVIKSTIKETKTVSTLSNVTFNVTNRSTVIITTVSNAASVRGCWLILTANEAGNVLNLSPETGSSISIVANGGAITVTNNHSTWSVQTTMIKLVV